VKILIVDDDKTTRKILTLYLRGGDHTVMTAENGLDALEKIGMEPVDVIIADLNMPYMDGIELTRTIRSDASRSHIPVIMVSMEEDAEERRRAVEAGVSAYLIKPVTAGQIEESIRNVR